MIPALAIVVLTLLQLYAIHRGLEGTKLMPIAALIGALAGVSFDRLTGGP